MPGLVWVFAGPSLPPPIRPLDPRLVWRPPAMAGDALIALEAKPDTVVLIDGLFDRYPAIKHKELVALMGAGVRVIGGASMGALRAAELAPLGMVGVGRIYEAYASGRLIGDDEVALLHAPVEADWTPLSLPLVNVRATLQRALRARMLDLATAKAALQAAREVFYQDRTWPEVIARTRLRMPLAFSAWLAEGYVDLKRRDALACLAAALASAPGQAVAPSPTTPFTRRLARQVASGLKPSLGPSAPL